MFYDDLQRHTSFEALADGAAFAPMPDDWLVGASDIVGSTKAVAAGRYKTVNMVGAAVISAQINAHPGLAFPFVFGGDGAAFAVPPDRGEIAAKALAATRAWAAREFDMGLRGAMMSVRDIRARGHDVLVARYQVSEGVDYAMFTGGGVSWLEDEMKAGSVGLPEAPQDAEPDLSGLSCRWSHMPARKGKILSLVIAPTPGRAGDFAHVAREVVRVGQGLDRAGHPGAPEGPGVKWPPKGATLEAHAQKGSGSLGAARRKALFESFLAWALIKTGIVLGGFDARRYRRVVGDNADFRKFDDGLKMTIDCDAETMARLQTMLDAAQSQGILRYGMHTQDEAMMTCIVPAIDRDDHVHFVDGAGGGYTQAATQLKARL